MPGDRLSDEALSPEQEQAVQEFAAKWPLISVGDLRDLVRAVVEPVEREQEGQIRFHRGMMAAMERARPLCPDHRDKQRGDCIVCGWEVKLSATEEQARSLAEALRAIGEKAAVDDDDDSGDLIVALGRIEATTRAVLSSWEALAGAAKEKP